VARDDRGIAVIWTPLILWTGFASVVGIHNALINPDPLFGTGAIMHITPVNPMPKAGGKWNTYEISARGSKMTVTLNGTKTAEIANVANASGPIALQYGSLPPKGEPGGAIKWRKVQVREIK